MRPTRFAGVIPFAVLKWMDFGADGVYATQGEDVLEDIEDTTEYRELEAALLVVFIPQTFLLAILLVLLS